LGTKDKQRQWALQALANIRANIEQKEVPEYLKTLVQPAPTSRADLIPTGSPPAPEGTQYLPRPRSVPTLANYPGTTATRLPTWQSIVSELQDKSRRSFEKSPFIRAVPPGTPTQRRLEFEEAKEQFKKKFDLSEREFEEAKRQFMMEHNLSERQFEEAVRQFNLTHDLERKELQAEQRALETSGGVSYGLPDWVTTESLKKNWFTGEAKREVDRNIDRGLTFSQLINNIRSQEPILTQYGVDVYEILQYAVDAYSRYLRNKPKNMPVPREAEWLRREKDYYENAGRLLTEIRRHYEPEKYGPQTGATDLWERYMP